METTLLVGAQFGDEGKGKLIDVLAEQFTIVARYQGGANAGHTLVVDGKKHVFHLLPSGILRDHVTCVLGNGMVIHPETLLREIEQLEKIGLTITPERLKISGSAHVITQEHITEDQMHGTSIGTTGRGIGPAYKDKIARTGIRLWQYIAKDLPHSKRLRPYVTDVSMYLQNTSCLIEGAQGTMLDIDHGTYPYVTSSNCSAGGACTGLGIPPKQIKRVLGVFKAYLTRVGNGPMPTELTNATGKFLGKQGNEFGSTTGRPRRCGWFDAVQANYAIRLNGIDEILLTKLDVLTGLKEINICVGYQYKGKKLTTYPTDTTILAACQPIYQTVPGWNSLDTLPPYLTVLEDLLGIPITLVSTGPEREAIVQRKNI